MAIADEPLGLLGGAKLGIREAEGAYTGFNQRVTLSRTTPDGVVLHEHDPAMFSRVAQPPLVRDVLARLLAVDGGHGVDHEAMGTQRLG